MRLSAIIATTMALAASAAPWGPKVTMTDATDATDTVARLSEYFNLLAIKSQAAKINQKAPVCDLSRAKMPVGTELLPAPEAGLKIHHVAVGRGTQNYTCDAGNSTAAPAANGAVAVLFNASCVAALYPELLDKIPGMAIHFDLPKTGDALGPSQLPVSGVHYFLNKTTPYFDLNTKDHKIGTVAAAKVSDTPAPAAAAVGQHGEKAVPWLRLGALEEGTTDNIKLVYRVTTAGGSAPATCADQPAEFQIEYAAVYWFWEGTPTA